MARSYKICVLKNFESAKFSASPYFFDDQMHFEEVDRPPTTSIRVGGDSIAVEGFSKYILEHEVEEKVTGRIYAQNFSAYIRKGLIDVFPNTKRALVLLSGKKKDVLDFCRKDKKISEFKFNTIKIDMKKLLTLLSNVKGVWFSFNAGQITSSALMGHNVQGTPDFKHFKQLGDISTLSFHFEFDRTLHPIMVTEDGTVVTQAKYQERTEEINLVLAIKKELLNPVLEEIKK